MASCKQFQRAHPTPLHLGMHVAAARGWRDDRDDDHDDDGCYHNACNTAAAGAAATHRRQRAVIWTDDGVALDEDVGDWHQVLAPRPIHFRHDGLVDTQHVSDQPVLDLNGGGVGREW